MTKSLSLLSAILLFSACHQSFGQGTENFNNYPETANAYHDGTFTGQDGSTWSYTQSRGDSVIIAPSPVFGKKRPITSKIISGIIHGGCGTISFDYKQPFTSAVNLNLFVNGLLVKNVTSTIQGTVSNSGPVVVNTPGDFFLMFKQADSSNSGQVTIDNVIWTSYGGGPAPEPTNYPTNFIAATSPFTIELAWTDAIGPQLPAAYIIIASDQNNIVAPVDGTQIPDDINLLDGHGALNIFQGVQHAAFGNLPGNKQYYFKIFPYTNSAALINYKNDGTAPGSTAITPNTVIIDSLKFANRTFSNWIVKSVTGAEGWVVDSLHGINGGSCGKMSGYAGQSNVNEDWLISPSMNFSNYANEVLMFQSAYKYTGAPLELFISNDYDGISNPGNFTWIPLAATWSAGNYEWASSGIVNVSGTTGAQVYIGFKYTSDVIAAATWELDDIVITGDLPSTFPHFTPVWTGNPVYPMNISVTQALLDGLNLVSGDEIGIFDGSVCVGAYKLTAPINPVNPPFIVISKDDPSTPAIDGYNEGHQINYRLWKSANSQEIGNVTHNFPYAPQFVFETFTQNETAIVALTGVSTVTQNTTLIAGWNIISFNNQPANMNLLDILQPLVTSGTLVKVIDEAGGIIQNFPWGWVNNIGNMALTEGYYIKVASNCTITSTGSPSPASTTIPLMAGWNMMGYPCQNPQNALAAMQSLITSGALVKVIDEAGNIIQYFPWGWVNNIGNFKAGEGYYVKVSVPFSLTFVNSLKTGDDEDQVPAKLTSHFTLPCNGNPFRPMALGIIVNDTIFNGMENDDEVGVFDGDLCVGAIAIDKKQPLNLILTAFSDDLSTPEKDGFTPGNPITLRYWYKKKNREVEIETTYISGEPEFTELGTRVVKMQPLPETSSAEFSENNWLGDNHPNPFKESTTIEYNLGMQAWVTLKVFSAFGPELSRVVNELQVAGRHKVTIKMNSFSPGIYFYQLQTVSAGHKFIQTKKMIISK